MDRRHLDYFLAVADYGGFTNASHVLRIAQPSLSQAIKSLEAELGVQLFKRLPQGTRLTSAGEALMGPARQTLREFAAAHAAVTKVRQVEAGRLDIAALPGLAPLAPLFGRFHTEHPHVRIRITDPRGADILGLVRSGEVDLAVALTAKPTSELAVVDLPGTRILIAFPPGSAHEPGAVVTASDLEDIGLVEGTTSKQLVLAKLADIGVTPPITVETDHREAVLPLVLQGCGACLVAESMAHDAAARGAVLCRLDPEPAPHKQLLVHRRADVSPAASAFISTIAAPSAASSGTP